MKQKSPTGSVCRVTASELGGWSGCEWEAELSQAERWQLQWVQVSLWTLDRSFRVLDLGWENQTKSRSVFYTGDSGGRENEWRMGDQKQGNAWEAWCWFLLFLWLIFLSCLPRCFFLLLPIGCWMPLIMYCLPSASCHHPSTDSIHSSSLDLLPGPQTTVCLNMSLSPSCSLTPQPHRNMSFYPRWLPPFLYQDSENGSSPFPCPASYSSLKLDCSHKRPKRTNIVWFHFCAVRFHRDRR